MVIRVQANQKIFFLLIQKKKSTFAHRVIQDLFNLVVTIQRISLWIYSLVSEIHLSDFTITFKSVQLMGQKTDSFIFESILSAEKDPEIDDK